MRGVQTTFVGFATIDAIIKANDAEKAIAMSQVETVVKILGVDKDSNKRSLLNFNRQKSRSII
jgi:hypothetical protein